MTQTSNLTRLGQTMDQCIKCNICQSYCPVAAVTGEFPGPKYTGPQAQRFRMIDAGPEISPMLCNGCGVCTSVCPNDVPITDIITMAKAGVMDQGRKITPGQHLLNRPDLIGKLSSIMPWLANAVLSNRLLRRIAERLFGIDRDAPLPAIRGRAFARWFGRHRQAEAPVVSYFQGCSVGYYDAQVGIDTVDLLNRLGLRVEVPSDLCCSLPMLSSGEFDAARPRARALVDALTPAAGRGPIIATSTSCGMTLRSKYKTYLDMRDEHSAAVGRAVVDISEFIRDNHADRLRSLLNPLPLKVLYHGPCQLRSHQAGLPAVTLMRLVPMLEIELSQADCCGIGGTYGYDVAKSGISRAIGETLVAQAARSKPDLIVCDSETCRWNIEQKTGIPTIHPAQLLLRSIQEASRT